MSKIIAMLELILSKKSSESEIKSYFNAVLELSKSDNEFPINLDEVWMLVYGRKEEAVRALTSSEQFIENIDYQVLRKNAENQKGGRPTNEYKLTVSCMEFFIARKVRPVFEVYRQVFHKVAKHELSRKELALMVIQAEEEKERLALENKKQQKQIEKLQPKADFADAAFKKILFSFLMLLSAVSLMAKVDSCKGPYMMTQNVSVPSGCSNACSSLALSTRPSNWSTISKNDGRIPRASIPRFSCPPESNFRKAFTATAFC